MLLVTSGAVRLHVRKDVGFAHGILYVAHLVVQVGVCDTIPQTKDWQQNSLAESLPVCDVTTSEQVGGRTAETKNCAQRMQNQIPEGTAIIG